MNDRMLSSVLKGSGLLLALVLVASISGCFPFVGSNDQTPPHAPLVYADTPTNNARPTWYWSIPDGSARFRISLDSEGNPWSYLPISQTAFIPPFGLDEGTHELFVQSANTSGDWSESGSKAVIIDFSVPNPPIVHVESPTSDDRPTWTWSAAGPVVAFQYQLNSEAGVWRETTNEEYTPESALPDGVTVLFVQARNLAGTWSVSGSAASVVDTVPPAPPGRLLTETVATQTPVLSWESVHDAVNYELSIDSSTAITNIESTQYAVVDSLAEGSHTIRLKAVDIVGNRSIEAEYEFVVDLSPPPIPAGLSLLLRTPSSLWIGWDNVSVAASCTLVRADSASGPFSDTVYVGPSASYIDESVQSGSTYHYVVSASNEWGSSEQSAPMAATTRLTAPTSVNATDGTRYGYINISWSTVTNVDGYTVYRADVVDGTYDWVADAASPVYVDYDVVPEWIYYYRVSASSSMAGESDQSIADSGYALPPRGTLTIINTTGIDRVQVYVDTQWVAELRDYYVNEFYTNTYSMDVQVGTHTLYAERPFVDYYHGPVQVFVPESGWTYTLR